MAAAMNQRPTLLLDTHAAFVRLVEAGASEDMAQALVDMHVGILTSGLATMTHIGELRADTQRTETSRDSTAARADR